jgi:hypothetical protein
MTQPKSPPPDTVPRAQFEAEDERRQHSRVLSYGSGWIDPGWTDDEHKVELMWLGATHEVVAYYISYDWSRLGPGQLNRDAAVAGVEEIGADVGSGVGRMLGDMDLATSDIHVRVLGVLHTALQCHELLWDWRWMQHHSDGLAHVTARITEHAAPSAAGS